MFPRCFVQNIPKRSPSCQPASGITEADELGSNGPNQQEPPACKEPWFAHGTPLPPSHTHPNRYTTNVNTSLGKAVGGGEIFLECRALIWYDTESGTVRFPDD